ncbi:hypothetical protein B0T24DRAFT_674724 [Lasiosphaeria ovina]|uniref:Uncharacterized protein n=1 Tax=Lasiosphaeria ovina TaxID=92902 RepID=A0AAE0KMC8_9PEZI|nr:hypothetical protein B0T24DRAFT_674724 [Lasiosphaeria ovina]
MSSSTTFSISAAPGTDIWRKPPHTDVFNAPAAAAPGVTATSGPLLSFVSARASFSFAWSEQYDQGGLLLSFRPRTTTGAEKASSSSPTKWVKTGIEFYNGRPMLSTVACDRWADWSVGPLTTSSASTGAKTWTTISVEREINENATNENGSSWWVYQILEGGEKVALREICWVYGDGNDAENWELEVLAMAARPEKNVNTSLEVEVRDMEVKWAA